jgi:hypothetical protein
MRKKLLFFLALLMLFTAFTDAQDLDLRIFACRSGIVEYRFNGTQEGVGTLYFDDFGFRTHFLLDVLVAGRHTRTITITIGEDQYMFDAEKSGEGIKLKNRANLVIEDQDSVIRNVYGKIGLEKTGSVFFMGKDCDLWQGKAGKVLLWNGIVLRKEIDLYGNRMHQEALSLKTDIAVDQDLFTTPENISFVEMPVRPGF